MTIGVAGDLWEVRDAQYLVTGGELAELAADDRAESAADVGVDFVEDQDRDTIALRQHALQRQHDARELAAGGDLAEGLGSESGISLNDEFQGVETGGG